MDNHHQDTQHQDPQHDDAEPPGTQPPDPQQDPGLASNPQQTTVSSGKNGRLARVLRRRPRGRVAVAATAAAAALVVGGAGFGTGYALGSHDTEQTNPSHQGPGLGPDGEGFDGPQDGRMGGPLTGQDGQRDGSSPSGEAPDFDGDGQPDDTSPGTTQDSSPDTSQDGAGSSAQRS
ncbi:hypothetical protein G6553_01890 [Nocardioides sp. IC4_145]|uniref:hypothetical protein n=1 Tax=Nocardioides sp. IC4_145 TaxID=2714037 RepID=UPI00140DC1B0|nr:hypothetical protein [Nocardioides sp. IC4_145]NHC21926.1 hypothetical protein [Nocardioides sp. IC4_145]